MVNSVALPFGDGVTVRGKSSQPGRPVFEFDRAAGQSTDRPQRNARGAALFRHQAMLQLADGADVLDVTLTTDREDGFGAFAEVALDPADARISVQNQKDGFDLRVSVSGTYMGGKKAAS